MTKFQKSLVMAALLAMPFSSALARDNAEHQAWLKAQKIDIKPTLTVTETKIPAGSSATTSGTPSTGNQAAPSSIPYGQAPSANMPSTNMPSTNMPSTGMHRDTAPARSNPGVHVMPK